MRLSGVGLNDADYMIAPIIDGRRMICPFYVKWRDMLVRCYNLRYQEKHPTYIGCSVCSDWISFVKFRTWMNQQDWADKELDKDLIGDGKLYSPTTCCFVPQWLNKMLANHSGVYPQGVAIHGAKFRADIRIDGKKIYLGLFSNVLDASLAYLSAKREYVTQKIADYPDARIRNAVLQKFDKGE